MGDRAGEHLRRPVGGWPGIRSALRLLVGHLFGAFGPHRIELDTWSGNERAVRAFAKAGFREEDRRRGAVPVAGRRYDTVLFGMVREEWPGGTG
ncbi:GNAT family N-acetyltransferase [Streptomyces sp. NPDC059832]|uniref:GNAT family N-acetyltransferase n=1 Tax=unclassified Streptomyces TaxID=2593676 RepID=UPI00365A43FE